MDTITLFQVSSLEKVFIDYTLPEKEYIKASVLRNEKFSYQIAYMADRRYARLDVKISVESPIADYVTVRQVGNVPVAYPIRTYSDEHYERYNPGLYPDVLYPLEGGRLDVQHDVWHSLWITVDLDGRPAAGIYPVTVRMENEEVNSSATFELEIIDALLPKQDIIFTQWLHADCLANYYQVPAFSKEHWRRIEQFVYTAVDNGINMMLTPIFTPPLDTDPRWERTTVQLVDVERVGENYRFNFDKLRHWIRICLKCGIEYFEMAHLFTQWGLEFTPKIMAVENGKEKRIFGWDVPAESPEYMKFLSQLLPAMDKVLAEEGVKEHTFFHISDEPPAECLDRYNMLKKQIRSIIPDYIIIDALSTYEFYSQGVVDWAICATNHIQPFIENKVDDLWCYYCCSQAVKVSNRFMAMPSYRNRVIGLQFYKFAVKGFLHWGYNFYNSALSKKPINPFMVTDAIEFYPAGDSFSVYPGEEGPLESLRLLVFYDALQDQRALNLLESYIGKEAVVRLIEEEAGMEIQFDAYPHDKEFLLRLRERINHAIKAYKEEL